MAPKGPSVSLCTLNLSFSPSPQLCKAIYFHRFISRALHLSLYLSISTSSTLSISLPQSPTQTLSPFHTHRINTKIETLAHTGKCTSYTSMCTHTYTQGITTFFFLFSQAFSHTQTVFPNQAALAGPQVHNSASKQTSSSYFLLFPFLCLREAKTKKSTNWYWQITHSRLYPVTALSFSVIQSLSFSPSED